MTRDQALRTLGLLRETDTGFQSASRAILKSPFLEPANLKIPKFFCAHTYRSGVAYTYHVDVFARSAQQTGEDLAGSDFNEQIAATRKQTLHTISPSHRAGDLLSQCRPYLQQGRRRFPCHVTNDRETRELQLRFE